MKKYFGYGNFFCWHCGRRQEIGRYQCPHCGAHYNKPASGKVKYTVNPRAALGNLHPSFIRVHVQYVVFSILFGILWSVVAMYWLAGVTDRRVYILIWSFWIIWLIGYTLVRISKISKSRARNLMPGPTVVCGYCGHEHDRHANFCEDCGCVILKPSTEEELTVDPAMSTVGISSTYTKEGKRRQKPKRQWGMTLFWIVFAAAAMYGIYSSNH